MGWGAAAGCRAKQGSGRAERFEGKTRGHRGPQTHGGAFENKPAISALHKCTDLCASPHGYDVLAAFLGKEPDQGPATIADADPTQTLHLRAAVAAEVQRVAAESDSSIGAVLQATWEIAKDELHQLTDYDGNMLDAPARRDVGPLCSAEPRDVPSLPDAKGKVPTNVAMRPDVLHEIAALSAHLDRPLSWVANEAYVRGRIRLTAL